MVTVICKVVTVVEIVFIIIIVIVLITEFLERLDLLSGHFNPNVKLRKKSACRSCHIRPKCKPKAFSSKGLGSAGL